MPRTKVTLLIVVLTLVLIPAAAVHAQNMLVPMDLVQTNHLKAYGLAFHALQRGYVVKWYLNYRGGSFLMPMAQDLVLESRLKNVLVQEISGAEVATLQAKVEAENMEIVILEKDPKIAVYIPPVSQPWDDAVTLADRERGAGLTKGKSYAFRRPRRRR